MYHRIASRRGKKKAIIAVARTILEAAYFILRDGVFYQELGADYFDQRNRERTIQRLTQRLNRLGLTVILTDAPAQPTAA